MKQQPNLGVSILYEINDANVSNVLFTNTWAYDDACLPPKLLYKTNSPQHGENLQSFPAKG